MINGELCCLAYWCLRGSLNFREISWLCINSDWLTSWISCIQSFPRNLIMGLRNSPEFFVYTRPRALDSSWHRLLWYLLFLGNLQIDSSRKAQTVHRHRFLVFGSLQARLERDFLCYPFLLSACIDGRLRTLLGVHTHLWPDSYLSHTLNCFIERALVSDSIFLSIISAQHNWALISLLCG